MYEVTVYRRQFESRKWQRTDRESFPIGQWKEIGYWLDERGYIEEDCRVEVKISND